MLVFSSTLHHEYRPSGTPSEHLRHIGSARLWRYGADLGTVVGRITVVGTSWCGGELVLQFLDAWTTEKEASMTMATEDE